SRAGGQALRGAAADAARGQSGRRRFAAASGPGGAVPGEPGSAGGVQSHRRNARRAGGLGRSSQSGNRSRHVPRHRPGSGAQDAGPVAGGPPDVTGGEAMMRQRVGAALIDGGALERLGNWLAAQCGVLRELVSVAARQKETMVEGDETGVEATAKEQVELLAELQGLEGGHLALLGEGAVQEAEGGDEAVAET